MNVAASLKDSRQSNARFNPVVFILASLAAAVALVSIVAIPQYFSKQARWDALRSQVGEIGQLAASVVDGDLHHKLPDTANYGDGLYARALEPLVRFHSANPNISHHGRSWWRGSFRARSRRIAPSALQPQAKGVGLYGAFQQPKGI